MYNSVVAGNVKRIIKNRCLSQGAIGKKADYEPKTFSNMLNGRKIVTDVDVRNIAAALEVDANTLFAADSGATEQTKEVV